MTRYIVDYSAKNGLGNPAISLYLTGCDKEIKCHDCHNWELQSESKDDYNIEEIKQLLDSSITNFNNFHNRLYVSILGGEPLAEYNCNITYEISKYLKKKYKDIIIVIYSWRDLYDIKNQNLEKYLEYIDYGVLGSYESKLKVENVLPSSTNQYIYDFNNKNKIKPIKLNN